MGNLRALLIQIIQISLIRLDNISFFMEKPYWGGKSPKRFEDEYQIALEYLRAFKIISFTKLREITGLQEDEIKKFLKELLNSGEITGEYREGVFYRDLSLTKKKRGLLLDYLNSKNKISLDDASRLGRLSERQTTQLVEEFLQEGIVKGKWENNIFINLAVESIPSQEFEVKREYDYVGGQVRFKVVVRNLTQNPISKINTMITVGDQYIVADSNQSISALMPGETRGVDFLLSPLTCGTSNIFGTVSYTDHIGEAHSTTIKPKDINIKCPLVVPAEATSEEVNKWRKSLLKGASSFPIHGIPRLQAFKIVCDQVAALDLNQFQYNEDQLSSTYTGVAKISGNKIIVAIRAVGDEIKLIIWTRDLREATGFIAYLKNLIKMAIDTTQKLRVSVEKVGQKILDALDIIERLFQLAIFCENMNVAREILLILKEIKIKIDKQFENLPIVELLDKWELEVTTQFDEEEPISEFVAASLFYEIINWMKEMANIASTNVKLYADTFKDDEIAIKTSSEKVEKILEQIIELEEIYSKIILKYIMVININSGILLYSQACSGFVFDGDLVSGFLSAVSSFGFELTKKESAMRAIQYHDFEIVLGSGNYISVAIVLSGKITEFLRNKLSNFVKNFEYVYESDLKQWVGDTSVFDDANHIVKSIFKVSTENGSPTSKKNNEEGIKDE